MLKLHLNAVYEVRKDRDRNTWSLIIIEILEIQFFWTGHNPDTG